MPRASDVRRGMSEPEVADRLKKTGYVFHVTPQQERYLTDRGVPESIVKDIHNMSSSLVRRIRVECDHREASPFLHHSCHIFDMPLPHRGKPRCIHQRRRSQPLPQVRNANQ